MLVCGLLWLFDVLMVLWTDGCVCLFVLFWLVWWLCAGCDSYLDCFNCLFIGFVG